jgi:nitrogen fixation protein NifU and related proteins
MSEETVYKEIILHHARNPKHRALMDDAQIRQVGQNPLCGDHIVIYLKKATVGDDDTTSLEISYEGYGCAITIASASILASTLNGSDVSVADDLCTRVLAGLAADSAEGEILPSQDLEAIIAVRDRPARVKCATLPWLALRSALIALANGTTAEPVSTE